MVATSAQPPPVRRPPFVGQLLRLNEAAATGVLEVEGDGVVTLIYVAEGVPVFAEAGTQADSLGRVLVADMKMTDEEYRLVLEHMTASLMRSEQLRFGEVAIAFEGAAKVSTPNGRIARGRHQRTTRPEPLSSGVSAKGCPDSPTFPIHPETVAMRA